MKEVIRAFLELRTFPPKPHYGHVSELNYGEPRAIPIDGIMGLVPHPFATPSSNELPPSHQFQPVGSKSTLVKLEENTMFGWISCESKSGVVVRR